MTHSAYCHIQGPHEPHSFWASDDSYSQWEVHCDGKPNSQPYMPVRAKIYKPLPPEDAVRLLLDFDQSMTHRERKLIALKLLGLKVK